MTATSPYLDQPKRDSDAAQADMDHRMHTTTLNVLLNWLQNEKLSSTMTYEERAAFAGALDYALNELHKHAAARILERNKRDG